VAGGWGKRGSEGKISAITYARTQKIPYLGICFGMQMAVLEAARTVEKTAGASSTEFGPTDHPVVGLMTEWVSGNKTSKRSAADDLGGTMRLGAYPCVMAENSHAATLYGATRIEERHRHRYEVNIGYRDTLEAAGLKISGLSPDGELPEIVEREDHPWFIGVQFHPELKSKPFDAHPLFVSFIDAAKKQNRIV